jgi:hypothetical protein
MDLVLKITKGWGVLLGVPALFVLAFAYPSIPVVGDLALCSVRRFTGYDCPGCGLKSAFIALAHGKVRECVDLHPLAIIVAGWLSYVFVRAFIEAISGRPLPALLSQRSRDLILSCFLFALILQWVVKLFMR